MEIYQDSKRTIEERTEDLLSRMTLSEKVAQMMQLAYSHVPKDEITMWVERGAGSLLHVLGDEAREMQNIALKTRLGIPLLFGIDAIHGHALHRGATVFPSQLALASSWNKDLVYMVGRVTAKEVAADGLHWTFSPVLCLGRDTRWGRIDETFGEDPYLAGEMGEAIVKGYQGNDLSDDDSILACAKHYIGYGEATGARDAVDTEITYRKMKEVFLPPFAKAVSAGVATVMTAYGSVDGEPFTASKKTLKTILKDELGFDGFVVTDWDNVGRLVTDQFAAADLNEASRYAVSAGNDMMMVTFDSYDGIMTEAEAGRISIEDIDEAVRRILRIKFCAGLFEKPEKKSKQDIFGCEEHQQINIEASKESLVLLENRNNVLPLSKDIKSIAVIGPNANDIVSQYGDWTYFSHPKDSIDKTASEIHYTVLGGVKKLAEDYNISVEYTKGCDSLSDDTSGIEEAASIAKKADAVILVLGDNYSLHGETKDRANLFLSGKQQQLFDSIRKVSKKIITVLVSSKPLAIPTVAEQTDALITMFNGGQYGGLSVAEVIFGEINPVGKLPISFPYDSGQLPVYYNYLPGWHGGKYADLPSEPLYPFGYGLSYTSYSYSNLSATVSGSNLKVKVRVTNTGDRDGIEIVEVYFNDLVSSVITPVKQLIAFDRVPLKSKETKEIEFNLDTMALSLVKADETRVIEPGDFDIMVGGSSKDKDLLKTTIRI